MSVPLRFQDLVVWGLGGYGVERQPRGYKGPGPRNKEFFMQRLRLFLSLLTLAGLLAGM